MLSTSPLAEPEAGPAGQPADPSDKPYDLNTEIPAAAADAPSTPSDKGEFVMGPRQMASLAFVGILILGIMSAIAYFAGRKNTESPKVTERVIERVVTAPPAAVTTQAPVQPPPPTPAPVKTEVQPPPAPVEAKAEVTAPILNRVYLQAGSVEVGVAEVMVEGLRKRGIPAIVGIGVNSKVARVLVGPFNTPDEQRIAQKKIEDMGFHPYPRAFTAKDLEQQQVSTTDPAQPTPAKP